MSIILLKLLIIFSKLAMTIILFSAYVYYLVCYNAIKTKDYYYIFTYLFITFLTIMLIAQLILASYY